MPAGDKNSSLFVSYKETHFVNTAPDLRKEKLFLKPVLQDLFSCDKLVRLQKQ
jgi:hypothetical protein